MPDGALTLETPVLTDLSKVRNIGISAHIDSGKTTLTERILFDAGAQNWVGSVDEGTAAMDFMPAERSRGISITSAATRVGWGDHVIAALKKAAAVVPVIEADQAIFKIDGEPVFALHRNEAGDWKFHL